jgi:hypothetical protein
MSFIDDKYLALFKANWSEAMRTANRLTSSLERLSDRFPLKKEALNNADEDFYEKLDAFRVRYSDLQDCIGNKLFRGVLKLEDERVFAMPDILNAIEKRGIITHLQQWKTIREVRNSFAHDYPESENEKKEALNLAFETAPELLVIINNMRNYLKKYEIDLESH